MCQNAVLSQVLSATDLQTVQLGEHGPLFVPLLCSVFKFTLKHEVTTENLTAKTKNQLRCLMDTFMTVLDMMIKTHSLFRTICF